MTESIEILHSGKKALSQRLSGFDLVFSSFFTLVFLYNHKLSEKKLIDSLKKAMQLNPYICGRLKGLESTKPIITAEDDGILWITQFYNKEIEDFIGYLDLHPDEGLIVPQNPAVNENTPLLQIKLSLYRNASALAVTFHHAVCDMPAFLNFLVDWAKLSRRKEPGSVDLNREHFHEVKLEDDNYKNNFFPVTGVNNDLLERKRSPSWKANFLLTGEFMQKLLSDARLKGFKGGFGAKDSLWISYVWKLIVKNRSSTYTKSTFSQVYNSRCLLGLNTNYFGNAGIFPFFHMNVSEVNGAPIEAIAKRVLSLRNKVLGEKDNLRRNIAFWDLVLEKKKLQNYWPAITEFLLNGEVLINNLSKLPFYSLDFGSGSPVWVDFPNREKPFRNIHVLPSPNDKKDVVLFVTLPKVELEKFAQESSIFLLDGKLPNL